MMKNVETIKEEASIRVTIGVGSNLNLTVQIETQMSLEETRAIKDSPEDFRVKEVLMVEMIGEGLEVLIIKILRKMKVDSMAIEGEVSTETEGEGSIIETEMEMMKVSMVREEEASIIETEKEIMKAALIEEEEDSITDAETETQKTTGTRID